MDNSRIIKISIAKDFSIKPGPRERIEGPFSGQEFRERIFEKKYNEAKQSNTKIEIDLDGTLGYGTSFLEEVFGGLTRKEKENILDRINIISVKEPYLIDDIKGYVEDARKE